VIKCCHKCTRRWQDGLSRCHATCEEYITENEIHQKDLKRKNTRAWVDSVKKDIIIQTKARIAK